MLKRCTSLTLLLACWFTPGLTAQALSELPKFLQASTPSPDLEANAWVLLESKTGWVISAHDEHKRVDPASLTKLMTAYLTFEALSQNNLHAEDKIYISKKAWKAPGSRMFLNVDTSVTVGDVLKGLIIQSGNDSAIALAEHLGGDEENFARLMNEKAKQLGMNNTHYINASGLPDENHYTTANDTAILSREMIQNFPDLYALFAVREYTYNEITQANRNGLLNREGGYDGLKTGHTKAAGYCLAGSAQRGNTRFIAVVMGAQSVKSREQSVGALVEYGFSHFETVSLMGQDSPAKRIPLFKGLDDKADIGSLTPVSVVVPRGQTQALQISYDLPEKLIAPLNLEQEIGQAHINFKNQSIGQVDLVPLHHYPAGPLWSQLIDAVKIKLF